MFERSRFASMVMQDHTSTRAGKVPARRNHPTFEYAIFARVPATDTNEVVIYRDGTKVLLWETRLTGETLEESIAQIIQRMKDQYMGRPRVAEAYI